LYNRFGEMSNEDFLIVSDPKNYASQLLLGHFFIIDYVLGELMLNGSTSSELATPTSDNFNIRRTTIPAWLERMTENLPLKYRKYAEWPLSFAREVIVNRKSAQRLAEWSENNFHLLNLQEECEVACDEVHVCKSKGAIFTY
jgi:hypothetical protein